MLHNISWEFGRKILITTRVIKVLSHQIYNIKIEYVIMIIIKYGLKRAKFVPIHGHTFLATTQPFFGKLLWNFAWNVIRRPLSFVSAWEISVMMFPFYFDFLCIFDWKMGYGAAQAPIESGYQNPTKVGQLDGPHQSWPTSWCPQKLAH